MSRPERGVKWRKRVELIHSYGACAVTGEMVHFGTMRLICVLSKALVVPGFLFLFAVPAHSQAPRGNEMPPEASSLAILLDTSAEMGFLIPQLRKELRILNEQLAAAGRPAILLREMEGAALDREGSTSVGARKNLIYPLKELFLKVDTVYWVTSLQGEQSPAGMFGIEELLREKVEDRPDRQLIIRNIWQDQVLAGDSWVLRPPPLSEDPLDLRNRPEGWYRLVEEKRGLILRSWQTPPWDFRECFGFPYRVNSGAFLKKMEILGREALFDQSFARAFTLRHGLMLSGEKEGWPSRMTGRRWLGESTLLPFLDEAARVARASAVMEALFARETIAEDLARIEASQLGVIFGFGYLEKDLKSHLAAKGAPPRSPRGEYMADLVRIVGETLTFLKSQEDVPSGVPVRHYLNERIELENSSQKPDGPDPYARSIAKLVREKEVDAIYLFTNAYVGGGEYGTSALDLNLFALALRESGVRLYVRIPFEFGPVPMALARLALASGGEVFQGRRDDPDWEIPLPGATWPEPVPENP